MKWLSLKTNIMASICEENSMIIAILQAEILRCTVYFFFFVFTFFFSLSFLLVKKSNEGQRLLTMSITWIYLFNPLSVNGELSRHENLTFFWTWILRWVPRSFATHASLCNTLSSNKLCPKTVKILSKKEKDHLF